MKNSHEEEWLNKVSQRLREYTEEPDADTWDKIVARAGKDRDTAWAPWIDRTAIVIGLLALSSIWFNDPDGFHLATQGESASLARAFLPAESKNEAPGALQYPQLEHASDKNIRSQPALAKDQDGRKNNVENKKTPVAVNSLTAVPDDMNNGGDKKGDQVAEPPVVELLPAITGSVVEIAEKKFEEGIQTTSEKADSIRYPSIEKESRRRKPYRFFVSLTPVFTYQKISPFKDDRVVISRFLGRPVFSADRMGVNLDAALEGKIKGRFEFYSGFHLYHQSQTLAYERAADMYDKEVYYHMDQQYNFSYAISPGYVKELVTYDMFNVGIQAGVLYHIKGEKLKQKIGAGFLYEQGLEMSGDTYDNSRSRYGFYQLFYRNEYVMQKSLSLFVQPVFSYAIISKERLGEPFALKPYRAGISFGVVYTHGQ